MLEEDESFVQIAVRLGIWRRNGRLHACLAFF